MMISDTYLIDEWDIWNISKELDVASPGIETFHQSEHLWIPNVP